jgi:hypothetical protein
MPSRRFTLRNLLLVLAVWVVGAVIFLIIQAPYAAGRRLECVRYVIRVVSQHVKDHGGQWPKNWQALERVRLPSGAPDRPGDWQVIHQNVRVDFGADPAVLLKQGPEAFQAIRPKGGSCGDYTEDVQTLLAAIRAGQEAKEAKNAEKGPEGNVTTSGTSSR